jgi:DNA-binding PadR family transcriptional regulator
MRQVADQTEGHIRLGPATLYGSIQSLLEAGMIEEVDAPARDDSGDERRRYYRISTTGRNIARDEAERLAGVLRVARAKNILRGEYV